MKGLCRWCRNINNLTQEYLCLPCHNIKYNKIIKKDLGEKEPYTIQTREVEKYNCVICWKESWPMTIATTADENDIPCTWCYDTRSKKKEIQRLQSEMVVSKEKKPRKETIILDWTKEYLKGEKESNWKLSYELHRPFITAMAKRMSQNKGKYPPYNRQKPMDIEELKQALFRHTIEVMNWNYTDIEDNDHLQAISLNAMFIYYQLTNG